MTGLDVLRLVPLQSTAVAMAAGFAHVLALPNRIGLGPEEYLAVQQIYRGWGASLYFVALGSLVLSLLAARD